jgi:esterase/lipase superfamily enzyme
VKQIGRWYSDRIQQEIQMVRWGAFGTPVLLFPTAGGDAEEIERFLMIKVLKPLIEAGRIKVYSVDAVASRALLSGDYSPRHCAWLMNQFDGFLYHEVVPAIRTDCKSAEIELISAGASIGAFNALAVITRHPDVFKAAVCMSGSFDLDRLMRIEVTPDFYFSSPLHFLPNLGESKQLRLLRQRFILLAHGEGRYEDPEQNWRIARILGAKGVPNRVDNWGPDYDHDWMTWRAMLPKYLDQLV